MTPAARVQAAIEILDRIGAGQPAEQVLTTWARQNRYAGSGDRAAVRDHVFDALRQHRSAGQLGGGHAGRALMLGLLRQQGAPMEALFCGTRHAPAALTPEEQALLSTPAPSLDGLAVDLPEWLLPLFRDSLGAQTDAVVDALRHRAPVFLRTNLARTTREAVQAQLATDGIVTEPHPLAETALMVSQNARRVQGSAAYRDGLVELQDASSQAVVAAIPIRPGDRVLDYCAGGGGKSLALAARGGEVFAHDVDPRRMADLPARATRAGVQIPRLTGADLRHKGPFDVVLTDVPCSGSGSWRRTPEAKWRLTPDRLAELEALQSSILSTACDLVRPGGYLVYATCSLIKGENRDQIDRFLLRHPDWTCVSDRALTPLDGGDGFYSAILRCKSH